MSSIGPKSSRPFLVVLFTATIFLAALLLFFVQPLFTRMVLPLIGGAPAVWTTAMLFFQTLLIAGYAYAHFSTRLFSPKVQVAVHVGLLVSCLLFLPLAVPTGWTYNPESPVVTQTLWLYALGVGLPFAVMSANASLIQSWFGRTGADGASDPYFLYSASNFGSFLALLGFPLLAEPLFGISATAIGWSLGFILLIPLVLLAGVAAVRGNNRVPDAVPEEGPSTPVTAVQLLHWAFLAFLPSSLMLCVTTKISTDIGSFPLVWVIPLALYLLTFVLVFSTRTPLTAARLWLVFPLALGALACLSITNHGTAAELAVLVVGFFVTSLLAHRLLYDARPAPRYLTLFYITMSVGGALGGLFNSIVAPLAFDRLTEFPVTIALFALLLLYRGPTRRSILDLVIGLVLGGIVLVLFIGPTVMPMDLPFAARALLIAAILVLATVLTPGRGQMAGALTLMVLLPFTAPLGKDLLLYDRSFFGAHVVRNEGERRLYMNGTTVHGAQRLADYGTRPRPISYYHPDGLISQVLTEWQEKGAKSVGIVGLGTGALACYSRPGEDWHYYEIDQKVVDIALDPAFFTYMSECAPDPKIHLGDARVVLSQQPELKFDVLVIDAYSSDAVPVHLSTLEAMQLYVDRLNPGGVVIFHISNRYYDLTRPLARSAQELGLQARYRSRTTEDVTDAPFDVPSTVLILTKTPEDMSPFASDPAWQVHAETDREIWTDDRANLLSALK